jgi:phosphoserine aminotransferase
VIARSRRLLGLPESWRLGIVPGSDTGAFEMALWSLLGPRAVDVLAWESFGEGWAKDVTGQLCLNARVLEADYGELPELGAVDFDRDVILAWNGTTSGVCVPNGDWIPAERSGLVLCDATSAVFALEIPWDARRRHLVVAEGAGRRGRARHAGPVPARGGEARDAYALLAPPEDLPSHEGRQARRGSVLGIHDQHTLDALRRGRSRRTALGREPGWTRGSLGALAREPGWIDFLARDPATRSSTSICLRIVDPTFEALEDDARREVVKELVATLETEAVAYDIGSYRDAPPGLRLWGGATVEREDLELLFPWLDWAWSEIGRRT